MVHDYRQRIQAAEEALAQLRALDPTTGAGTYSQLKASLDSEFARSRRYGRPLSALIVGFDEYQALRHQLGRDRCDQFMAQTAGAIRSTLRGADRLFRLEADEFVLLLPETSLAGARFSGERIASLVRELVTESPERLLKAKLRIGGAVFPHPRVTSSEELLREANRVFRELREAGPDKLLFDV
jgi:diguanylate cyclase (GGDEF)-like protein